MSKVGETTVSSDSNFWYLILRVCSCTYGRKGVDVWWVPPLFAFMFSVLLVSTALLYRKIRLAPPFRRPASNFINVGGVASDVWVSFNFSVGEMGDCYNGSWARQLKIPVRRLNQLEATFLNVLQWNLQCSACEFDCMVHKVEAGLVFLRVRRAAIRILWSCCCLFSIVHHGCQFRSFLTYADLLVLCQSPNGSSAEILLDLVKQLMKVLQFANIRI